MLNRATNLVPSCGLHCLAIARRCVAALADLLLRQGRCSGESADLAAFLVGQHEQLPVYRAGEAGRLQLVDDLPELAGA